jgi:signal transduction histidine kinase/AraC-like DNA-binding protein
MDELRDAGRVVPQDVAVIGFDDRLEARAQVPSLTTVHYPMFELGYQAVALLFRAIEGRMRKDELVCIPTRLILRESCGCLPGTFDRTDDANAMWPAMSRPGSENTWAGHGTDQGRLHQAYRQLTQAMVATVYNESHGLSLQEITCLGQRLAEAFKLSLVQADPDVFFQPIRQILERVSTHGDDLYAWQAAISILRTGLPVLTQMTSTPFSLPQIEDILHQARVAISKTARGGSTRLLIHQARVADQVSLMTSQFFSAQSEGEIYDSLIAKLPSIGIQHATVGYYEAAGDDSVAWSVLQTSHPHLGSLYRFPSREFPPAGLYAEPFHLALLPLSIQETVCGFVAFDASDLEPCADIVRQLGAALRGVRLYQEAIEARRLAEEGKQLAEEANRLKSRFLSMVSHELRAPLNVISGLSHMLLKDNGQGGAQPADGVREDLERIYISAQHLDGLIRDVLDLVSSDVGHLKLSCEPLDMKEVVEVVSTIGEKLASDKGLAWQIKLPEKLPQVWGDRARLRQVILNLISNAVKFTTSGHVTLAVTAGGDLVTVSVSDTGLGIPAQEQAVIFDEFRQSERTAARGYGGLGLGLSICKRLLEMHGGEIGVRSSGEEGGGSTFYFSLPTMKRQVSLPARGDALSRVQRVFLLVKDALGGDLLKGELVRQEFEVELCQVDDGADWQAVFPCSVPDVVALDLGMASEQGWEMLKILKENPATRDIPVLFYMLEGKGDRGSFWEIDYLTKPLGTAVLTERLIAQGLLEGGNAQEPKTILVVDDEPDILEIHTRIVKAEVPNCRVIQAQDGREALRLIRQERPALVLLDLMMPELDGFAVLEVMRQEELSRNIPVIVVTGQVLTADDMARLNCGVASVLGKGIFSVEETLAHVAGALAHKRKAGSEIQQTVRKAMAYMHVHHAEPISRGDIAAYVGLSERHLTRTFRQEVGITLSTYLNRYRVREAKALLDAGSKNITEIAMEVGFSSSSYFTRVFQQEVGVSPRAYMQGNCASRP